MYDAAIKLVENLSGFSWLEICISDLFSPGGLNGLFLCCVKYRLPRLILKRLAALRLYLGCEDEN